MVRLAPHDLSEPETLRSRRPVELTLEIRGIYATALTRLFLDSGMAVASSPSEVTAAHVHSGAGLPARGPAGVHIVDIPGGQGVLIRGPREPVGLVVDTMKAMLRDLVCRPAPDQGVAAEFPCLTKAALDEIRNTVLPTLFNHHRLSLIAPESVDLVEKRDLAEHPELRESLSRTLEKDLVWGTYRNEARLKIEHVKLDGRILYLSEGEIIEADPHLRQVTLRRGEFKGRTTYDGLDIPKDYGDYAVTVIGEGEWFYKHTYFRRHGELIGAYYNINTWVEFYPDRIRYVDLEVDVVAWPDGRTKITDEDELRERCERGYITPELRDRAMETAYRILSVAQASRDTSPDP
jgi:hypothetical protein